MTISIVALSARGEDVSVTFEIREGEHIQKESFLLSAARVADLRLTCGEVTTECYDTVSYGARIDRAVGRGLYLLGYGSCSEKTLVRKLVTKGEEKDVAREAVAILRQGGYVNEFTDAVREAERCVAKEWGKRRVIATLRAKGFPDDAVREALNALEDEGVDYVTLCRDRIRRQVSVVPSEPAKKQKLIAALMRYGFSASEIREAFSLLNEEE